MRRFLVIGNLTITSQELMDYLLDRASEGPCELRIVVPASHPRGAWSEGSVRADAEARLRAAMLRLGAAGVDASGEVGDASPVAAVADAVAAGPVYDEIVISTLPIGPSVWLRQDVPHRVQREHRAIPVTHVVATPQLVG
ncbi:MAG: hypothetical protein ACHQNA_12435 [Acidimicrobiales bacterium]